MEGPAIGAPQREEWLNGQGVLGFLRGTQTLDVPILIITPKFYVCSVLVDSEKLPSDLRAASVNWYCNPGLLWSIGAWRDRKSGEVSVNLHPPATVTGIRVFDDAEPIVFWRELPRGQGEYIEPNQKLAHAAGIHRMDSRNSYARLNALGDLEDIIRFGPVHGGTLCTMDARTLDQFMQATGTVLLRFFEVDQLEIADVWSTHDEEIQWIDEGGICGNLIRLTLGGQVGGTRLHGLQIISGLGDRDENVKFLLGEDDENQKNVAFRIRGVKEGTTRMWPPEHGQDRDPAPSLITPTFFNPAVLTKYKADTEKYEVTRESVKCVGAWFLRSYDVNSEGQVYAYLKDLWELPYSEQRYWQSFNEDPRTGITERSWMQDFERKPWPGHDALQELEALLHHYPSPQVRGAPSPIWNRSGLGRPGDRPFTRLLRPLTESGEDWARHILDLNKVVVEGLDKKTIKRIAEALGVEKDRLAAEGSLKLLERVLRLRHVDDDEVTLICSPLYEIYSLRSNAGVGHRGGNRPEGNLRDHYSDLIERTYTAMKVLSSLVDSGVLDVPEADSSVR